MGDLELCLQDNQGAWELQMDGTWQRRSPAAGEEPLLAQQQLLEKMAETGVKS